MQRTPYCTWRSANRLQPGIASIRTYIHFSSQRALERKGTFAKPPADWRWSSPSHASQPTKSQHISRRLLLQALWLDYPTHNPPSYRWAVSVASPSFPAANKCSFAIIVASERILDTQCSLQTRKCHADPTTAAASPLGPATRTLPPPTLRQRDFPSPLNKLYKEPIEELTSGKTPSNAVSSIDRRSARIMGSALAAKLTVPSHSGFSVLPPPPRYPGVGGYGVGGLGGIVPLVETNNTIEKPTGPEWQFLVGEGTYVLREDLSLATPPPHPSEAPIVNPNPLATNPQPASSGTKMSLVNLHPKPPPFVYGGAAASSLSRLATLNGSNDLRYSTEGGVSSEDGRATSNSDTQGPRFALGSAPAFGQGNAALTTTVTKDVNKRKKPKNNVTKSNSSFISRVIVNDSLSRRLTDRPGDGIFAFANINRAFQWLDMSSSNKQDYLVKILFTKAHCLCHDVNMATKGASHLDVVMGFSTGEIIWLEPIAQRYTRLNKNGVINNTPVAHVKWLPGSENLFMAAHMDGSLIVYDKEKEDAAFTPEDETLSNAGSEAGDATNGSPPGISMLIHKSVHSKNQKMNPVAAWKLSNQRIHAFSFSPDNRHLAVVSEDGTLRLIDYLKEELLDLFFSYYGGFSCVAWTPDGKYVLTGGQDDLISIWSMADSALVARCQGHESWVAALAFDPWRCDDRSYRFGSVGEDGRLCLWDFSAVMLHRPQTQRHRSSVSSNAGLPERVDSYNSETDSGIAHAVEPRARIPMLPPVMTKVIDKHPLCWLEFTEDAIITSCKNGHIRTWNRPGMGAAVEPRPSEAAS